jgi:DNA-directed RNA polymerase specialized sigma24 family protein
MEGHGYFPSTRHSIVQRIRGGDAGERRRAFGDLVAGYWRPVYKHVRVTWRLSPEEAQDATQGFFTEAFEKGWLERFEPEKGRFRTFVRVCADRYVMNRRQSETRLKRGGGAQVLSLDFADAEHELRTPLASAPDAEAFFYQEFVRSLFARAVAAVRAEFEAAGRGVSLQLFERYDIDPAEDVSYAELAKEFGLSVTQVTNALAHVRRSFRTHAIEALRGLCGSDEEFRREARELFGIEVE